MDANADIATEEIYKAIRTFTRPSPTGSMFQALFVDQSFFFGALSQAILATI